MSNKIAFDKDQIDIYLKAVAKQYKKLNRNGIPAEITLIGGASILVNYGFRDSTYDVDALIHASSSMKDAINYVTDSMGLPNGWLNEDFKRTTSYTPKLVEFSKPYKTFSNMINIRTIRGEYLVAMKLKAFRQYKHDISDIVGILRAHECANDPLTFERIDDAVKNLYDGWEHMPEAAQDMIQRILADDDMGALYDAYAQEEAAAKDVLLTFNHAYPNALKEDNLSDILNHLMAKQTEEKSESQ